MIWNSLNLPLRQQLDKPSRTTTLAQLLQVVDAKWPVWNNMAHRPSFYSTPTPSRTPYQPPLTQQALPPTKETGSRQAPVHVVTIEERTPLSTTSIWDDDITGFVIEYNASNKGEG